MLLIVLLMVVVSSLLLSALLQIKPLNAWILSIYLFSVSQIVIAGEVAGLCNQLNNETVFLAIHLFVLIILSILWYKNGRPELFQITKIKDFFTRRKSFISLITKYPDLFLLSAAVIVTYLVSAYLILIVPPNTNDSMTTYLARIGFWLQDGSFFGWATPNIYQLIFPVNSQLQILWTILLSGTDRYAGFVQLFSALICGLAIFGIARALKWSKAAALFSSLCWAAFPQIILQSSSTQTDLAITATILICFYFLIMALEGNKEKYAVLAGMALGLAFGTKQTIFFLAPGLFILLIFIMPSYRKKGIVILKSWVISSIAAALVLGSFVYLNNFLKYKNPLGPPEIVSNETNNGSFDAAAIKILHNPARHFYQFIDPVGLPNRLVARVVDIKKNIIKPILESIGLFIDSDQGLSIAANQFDYSEIPVIQEDTSWFGPLSVIVLLPAFFYQLFEGFKKRKVFILGLIISSVSFFLCVSLLKRGWTPYQGRYFVLSVSLISPLMACMFSTRLPGRIYRTITALLGTFVLFYTVLSNPAKPIIRDYWTFNQKMISSYQERGLPGARDQLLDVFTNKNSIFKMSRLEKFVLQGKLMRAPLTLSAAHIRPGETLGILGPEGTWYYPFFGEHFEYRVVPIYPEENLSNKDWLKTSGIDWILISYESISRENIPDYLQVIEELKEWGIYTLR